MSKPSKATTTDPRFARLHTDPRFVRPKASNQKVQVDERFKSLFDGGEGEGGPSGKGKGKPKVKKVDKYGRKVAQDEEQNELRRYYRLEKDEQLEPVPTADLERDEADDSAESEDEDEEPTTQQKKTLDLARGEVLLESSDEEERNAEDDESESDSDSDDGGEVTLGGATASLGRARHQRSPSIDLSETEPVFADQDDDEEELDDSDSDSEGVEPTRRLAIVNMDWDHLRAVDLYRVLASSLSATAPSAPAPKPMKTKKFDANGEEITKPSSRLNIAAGRLLNLRIYPSSFGAERMAREEKEGPPTEVFAAAQRAEAEDSDAEDGEETMVLGRSNRKRPAEKRRRRKRAGQSSDEEEEDSDEEEITAQDLVREQIGAGEDDYDTEALRKYQLERLRYYYAIATFDSPESAHHVFKEIQGTEFERTANVFDLQFVPDETSFEGDTVHDEATESSVAAEGASYTGIDFVTDALRHSKVKLTWDADDPHRKNKIQSFMAAAADSKGKGKGLNADDIKAYLASSSDEDEEDKAEAEDDFFEAPAAAAKKAQSGPQSKRAKLRALFGLDGGEGALEEQGWDGSKSAGKGAKGDGEMQITFAPALSTKRKDDSDDEGAAQDDENALEKYKRKEKERRERKRLERQQRKNGGKPVEEGPEFGGEDTGPGGFDDDFFADGGEDPFAKYDAGDMDSGDEIGVPSKKSKKTGKQVEAVAPVDKKKMSKAERRRAKEAEEEKAKTDQAELALLVGSDDEDDGGKHFDMRAILKAEKNADKKGRGRLKSKKGAEVSTEVKDSFEIDLKDDRFKSLHEDYDYAIDPTNPRFQKTRNMTALLSEGRKRRAKGHEARAPVSAPSTNGKAKAQADSGDLMKLVESVKRKAGETGGRGKRSKT